MCGRFVVARASGDLVAEYDAEQASDALPAPSWNIKPTQVIPVVLESAKGEGEIVRRLEPARWSIVPPWAGDLKPKFPTFNARVETAHEKRTFSAAVKTKRCIIPADGYYEWVTDADGVKHPHYITPESGEPISFAGLYSWWQDKNEPEDSPTRWTLTATILTRAAEGTPIEWIHDRVPVMLTSELRDDWLSPELTGDAAFLGAVSDAGLQVVDGLQEFKVAPLRGDGPELVAAV
ncbi:SOS response-associated peptidase [Lysinibacter cavernae]|uniref:SOS response-associated peptidase n=1 Tax=Lysinibacter cavernae TaxID=1640652 RepID=UPI0036110742